MAGVTLQTWLEDAWVDAADVWIADPRAGAREGDESCEVPALVIKRCEDRIERVARALRTVRP